MATRTGDMETTKQLLQEQLQSADFLSVLRGIDQENGQSVTTPGPAQVIRGQKQFTEAMGFPVAEVIGRRTTYMEPENELKNAAHEIAIEWTHVGDDETTIETQLERLVRATRDLLWNMRLVPIASMPILVASEEYTELLAGKNSAFVKGSQTLLLVRTFAT